MCYCCANTAVLDVIGIAAKDTQLAIDVEDQFMILILQF
jgi:hypothetical protein